MIATQIRPQVMPHAVLENTLRLAQGIDNEAPKVQELADLGRELGVSSYLFGRMGEAAGAAQALGKIEYGTTDLAASIGIQTRQLARLGGLAEASAGAGHFVGEPTGRPAAAWTEGIIRSLEDAQRMARDVNDAYAAAGIQVG